MSVVVTGLGAITCCGNSATELWHNIEEGNSGLRPSNLNLKVSKSKKLGQVIDFNLNDIFDSRWKSKIDRHIQFALNATHEAIFQSGIEFEKIDPFRIQTIIGTSGGGYDFLIKNQTRINEGLPALPSLIPGHINNMMSAYINMHYGINGVGLGIAGACAAGSQAITLGAMMIESGQADVVITGASDSWLSDVTISGFESLGAISFDEILPKPFDITRSGFAMSEGAGIIILENYQHAKSRSAKILAHLSGYGMNSDAYHPTSPDPEGKAFLHMIECALNKAKLNRNQIDYINAHATATKIGDVSECKNLFKIFQNVPYISSTKSMTGHSIGSTSAIEAIISILSIINNKIPGTINLVDIDPECPGKHLKQTIDKKINHTLSTSFGFGGTNGALIFSRH